MRRPQQNSSARHAFFAASADAFHLCRWHSQISMLHQEAGMCSRRLHGCTLLWVWRYIATYNFAAHIPQRAVTAVRCHKRLLEGPDTGREKPPAKNPFLTEGFWGEAPTPGSTDLEFVFVLPISSRLTDCLGPCQQLLHTQPVMVQDGQPGHTNKHGRQRTCGLTSINGPVSTGRLLCHIKLAVEV
jgi:hypothetical protein